VHRLGAAHLLRRLAEELEARLDAVLLERGLGGEYAAEGADAERGVRIGVAGGPGA
jgi:hypothetical protein